MKIFLGDITFPKSEGMIIPTNTTGLMNKGIAGEVIKQGWKIIEKEAKEILEKNKFELGDFFITGPGRLKRRGVKKIYHAIIKKLPNDFTSVSIIQICLSNIFKQVLKDKISSVSICGLGIEIGDLDKTVVAKNILNKCMIFDGRINIKIIDKDKEFIQEVNKQWNLIMGRKNNGSAG